ncbi:hypothetical protein PoB_003484200 [Plakobranchus ocellatus]|uniref:Uncharacterized protein n=1 Tax=Plakobranchus ocellatus TaxID=259542 RepID=A0AAV4AN32_9GAST|nr:hypothetical protein PoB_003484200 [Plakobranchus ocellatus]
MPSRGYIAGKPVSRWEADSDNIDIEYKNLDKPLQQHHPCPQCLIARKGIIIKGTIVLAVFLFGLIIGYLVRRNIHEEYIAPSIKQQYEGIQQDYDPAIRDELQARVTHVGNFEDSLHMLTSSIRMTATHNAITVLAYIKAWWKTFNFDSVTVKNYTVMLSYPNYTAFGENHVAIKGANNSTIFETRTNNSNLHPDISPFSAFSHSGNVLGDVVYCNFGRRQDYVWLSENGVKTEGFIHVIRYGKIHPSNKIKLAEEHGAAGVILYPDPAEYCAPSSNSPATPDTSSGSSSSSTQGHSGSNSYDDNGTTPAGSGISWWLQGDMVPSEHVRYWLTGDPSTPDYPALPGVPRSVSPEGSQPHIPVYPISYNDAHILMQNLGGNSTPADFHGGLNVPYKSGPGYIAPWDKHKVELSVSNVELYREIYNVLAIIRGKYEKDHYVVIGAHMDAWGYGGVDAGTSYAVIMDLARTFHDQFNQGWRPRRTIIFAFWDASKFGHIGAYEWTQEFEKQLSSGGVAYIDIDSAIRGNHSFYAESNPLLYDVIMQAAMSVPWRGEGGKGADGKQRSVFDIWKERGKRSVYKPDQPWINNPTGDGDHSPFLYRLGMSSLLTAFTYDLESYPELPTYPAHNTLQDDMSYVLNIDPGYILHSALVQVLCDIVLRLADSAIIPMDVTHYSDMMVQAYNRVRPDIVTHLGPYDAGMLLYVSSKKFYLLKFAISNFTEAADKFQASVSAQNKSQLKEFDVLEINDKLIRLSRAFIYEGNLLHYGQYRNVLMAPHPFNLNEAVTFPGLTLEDDHRPLQESDLSSFRRELVILVVAIRRARDILLDDFGPDMERSEF